MHLLQPSESDSKEILAFLITYKDYINFRRLSSDFCNNLLSSANFMLASAKPIKINVYLFPLTT
jgi:hypothetical protein